MGTVRVKFLRGTSLGNGLDANPGEVMDIDRRLFAAFVQQGRVVEVPATDDQPAPAPVADASGSPDEPVGLIAKITRKGKKNA